MANHALARRCSIAVLLLSCLLAVHACTKKGHQGDGAVTSAAPPGSASTAASASCDASVAASPQLDALPWAEAVRVGNWNVARQQLEALTSTERDAPETRYVRARVALALSDWSAAVALLDGLESKLPLLAKDIALARAQAQLHAGQVEEAARFFASQTSARALVQAAVAWEKAAHSKEAREAVDRAIATLGRSTDDTAVEAHAIRSRLAQAAGDRALAANDLRFVAIHATGRNESGEIGDAILALDPARALRASERLDRAQRMAREGDVGAALQELERAARAPGKPLSKGELAFAKGMANYLERGHYSEAAEAFENAARLDAALAPEATFRAAKAWARADSNERAAARYAEVRRKYAKSPWGERAAYQLARLEMLEGRWSDAVRSYATYLAQFAKGDDVDAARYEQAVVLLLAGRNGPARKALAAVARTTEDRLQAASVRELQAVAAWQAGDKQDAIDLWTRIARNEPLSWPALVAAARLVGAGQPAPLPIQPPASAPAPEPLTISLAPPADMLARLGLEADAEEVLRDREAGLAGVYGPRSAEAGCLLYSNLGRSRRRYQFAQRVAPAALLETAPSSSTRWAWECLFPRAHPSAVAMFEQRESLPSGLIHAVMRQESGFAPEARSPAGAVGLMQLIAPTARRIADESGVVFAPDDLSNPWTNIDLSARYLAKLLGMFRGEVPLALASYNAGPKAVGRWLKQGGDLPLDLWVARIPYHETRYYVARVMGNLARYGYLDRAVDGVPRVNLEMPKGIVVPDDAY